MWKNLECIASEMPVSPLLDELEKSPGLWKEITARQSTTGSPHYDTESIFLRWCKDRSIEAVFTEIPAIDYPAYKFLPAARDLVNTILEKVGGQELGRVLIVKLRSDGLIDKHVDEGAYADHYERFHLCLEAGSSSRFYVEQNDDVVESVSMRPGELFWFNHKKPHWALNVSDIPRIHLIVDAVAPKFRRERE